jgi:hypothetical protein
LLKRIYRSLEARIEHARYGTEWIPEQLSRENPLETFNIVAF